MFEYFMEKIVNNEIFLQETHSSHDNVINVINWCGGSKGG